MRSAEGMICDMSCDARRRAPAEREEPCVAPCPSEEELSTSFGFLPLTMHTHVMSSRSPFARKAFDTIRSAA
jgi:hypothetical protein